MNVRIYRIDQKKLEEKPRLVRASSSAQALRYVTESVVEVSIATADDMFELRATEVETASEAQK